MLEPDFASWDRTTLDNFAHEVWAQNKMLTKINQDLEQQLQATKADRRDAIEAYRALIKEQACAKTP